MAYLVKQKGGKKRRSWNCFFHKCNPQYLVLEHQGDESMIRSKEELLLWTRFFWCFDGFFFSLRCLWSAVGAFMWDSLMFLQPLWHVEIATFKPKTTSCPLSVLLQLKTDQNEFQYQTFVIQALTQVFRNATMDNETWRESWPPELCSREKCFLCHTSDVNTHTWHISISICTKIKPKYPGLKSGHLALACWIMWPLFWKAFTVYTVLCSDRRSSWP